MSFIRKAGTLIGEVISQLDPDIACYTEAIRGFFPDGYVLYSDANYGYAHTGERRKAVLWSKMPWTDVDTLGDASLPSGRFVSGITGGIRFVGVCIPWRAAHVSTGRKDRKPWEDHLTYCAGLKRVLTRYDSENAPVCLLGDFNQQIPRKRQPVEVMHALLNALPKKYRVATEGLTESNGKGLIDHVSISSHLHITGLQIIPRTGIGGLRLSDHAGVFATVERC